MSNIQSLGLNGALLMGAQSLNAQQVAISTIGNNISNINTPGYARQRANMETDEQSGVGGELDNGVSVSSIESLRSPLLDSLVQQSLGSQGYADNQASLTSTVQDALGEQFTPASSSTTAGTVASGSGPIQDALTTFFSALQNLASTPSDSTAREVVVSDAQTLATALNSATSRVESTQADIGTDASTLTTQINQLSSNIASLNEQITAAQAASGTSANDLIDTRTADVQSLSSLVNITTTNNTNGSINVALADAPSVVLVNDTDSGGTNGTQTLSATYNATAATPLTVSGSTSGVLGTGIPSLGSLGSDLDVANNVIGSPASSGNTGLLGALDGVANQLISQMNTQNEAGFDLSGNAGTAFFSGSGASGITVSASIVASPSRIAAASTAGATLDGSNAEAMANRPSRPRCPTSARRSARRPRTRLRRIRSPPSCRPNRTPSPASRSTRK
jgi:flagellar hook-associated protein 1 FlgK